MNLGLGTLAELRNHLLNEGLRDNTSYDDKIAAIGRGVSARFENECNRLFGRVEGDTFTFAGDRAHVTLPRYPVESIAAVEVRDTLADGWVDQGTVSDLLWNLVEEAGLVQFNAPLGTPRSRVRITYTAGYWFDESGDGAAAESSVHQSGIVALEIGAESAAVAFAPAFDAEDTAVVVTLSLVLPEGGIATMVNASAITAAGFTAVFGFPIQAEGYTLRWRAELAGSTPALSSDLPEGATERPADLYHAWLLQCANVWGMIDPLGLGLAKEKAYTSPDVLLPRLDLVPDVAATLRDYRRLTAT